MRRLIRRCRACSAFKRLMDIAGDSLRFRHPYQCTATNWYGHETGMTVGVYCSLYYRLVHGIVLNHGGPTWRSATHSGTFHINATLIGTVRLVLTTVLDCSCSCTVLMIARIIMS